MQKAMTKRDAGVVGTSRDVLALLEAIDYAARDLNEATELAVLTRTKISGRWLYATSREVIEAATAAVDARANEQLRVWLLGAIPYLRGPVSRSVSDPTVTSSAVELLIHRLVRGERIGVLPLLTNDYEPYLGLYALEDAVEIERQIESMKKRLSSRGYVATGDLPVPAEPREAKAWRTTILRHGEYLGLGRLENGALIAWEHG
jgi:hypothetical protein